MCTLERKFLSRTSVRLQVNMIYLEIPGEGGIESDSKGTSSCAMVWTIHLIQPTAFGVYSTLL